jgi:hypothetical protein
MYCCVHETGGEFLRGYAGIGIGHLLFASNPYYSAIGEWFLCQHSLGSLSPR